MSIANTLCTVSPDDTKKLHHSTVVDEGGVQRSHQPSEIEDNVNVLGGMVCFVGLETDNEW